MKVIKTRIVINGQKRTVRLYEYNEKDREEIRDCYNLWKDLSNKERWDLGE